MFRLNRPEICKDWSVDTPPRHGYELVVNSRTPHSFREFLTNIFCELRLLFLYKERYVLMENSREVGCKDQRPSREITGLTCFADVLASGLGLQNRTTFDYLFFFLVQN